MILVTGASSGIGKQTTLRLLGSGQPVFGIGRNQIALSSIQKKYSNFSFNVADLSDLDALPSLVEHLPSSLDGIVFSAGIVKNTPLPFITQRLHSSIMKINLDSPLLLLSALARKKRLNNGASVVFVSSINGPIVGIKGCASYSASKAALVGVTKVLALELAAKNIRVNCISPGMVKTPLVDNVSELSSSDIESDKLRYPLYNDYIESDCIADSILFLLGDQSSALTGVNLVVDSGYSLH